MIKLEDLKDAPRSNKTILIVGISGKPEKVPLSEVLDVKCGTLEAKRAFLLATNSPSNLLGRDLLCRLGCTVKCTEEGVYLDIPDDAAEETLQLLASPGPVVYW